MRIHIIQPTHYAAAFSRELYRTGKRDLVQLTLPYLAALIPPGHEVTLTDEPVETWNPDTPSDCVFITATILTSLRAYEIADTYRRRGVPVVMGGPHCMFYTDEALEHADTVAIGEGETLVPRILDDLAGGRIQRVYRAEGPHDLRNLPFPRHDLLDRRTYTRFHAVAVQTSRGCPYRCEFCAERFFLGKTYRTRPVEDVVEEVRRAGRRQIFFADSTFVGNRRHTMELMERLVPLGIRWSTLWNTDRVLDLELMKLAKRSGLLHINMGVESIQPEALQGMKKKSTPAHKLEEVVRILRKMDVSFSFNLIFGWDTDRLEAFPITLEWIKRNKVHVVFFNVFSPHKGTRIYDRFVAEGRMRDLENLGRWPGIIAEIRPRNFTAEELERNILWMYRQFYSWPSILERLPLPRSRASAASWFMNLSQRKMFADNRSRTNFDRI